MSYLDYPRFDFFGTIVVNPSTRNNIVQNYNMDECDVTNLWNKWGNAIFTFDAKVNNVATGDGAGADPLLGRPVVSGGDWKGSNSDAKIVDLDPQQQMVSMLYGLQFKVGSEGNSVTGDMQAVWFQNFDGYGAMYQSVLSVDPNGWGTALTGVLATLKEASPDQLSVRFMLDANGWSGTPPCHGHIRGTIGPADDGAPINFVPGRLLRPMVTFKGQRTPQPNFGQFVVVGDTMTVDFANLLPIQPGGSWPDGQLVTVDDDGNTVDLGNTPSNLDGYESSLVVDYTLTQTQQQAVAKHAVSINMSDGSGGVEPWFAEDPSGLYVNALPYVLRLQPDETLVVNVTASRFGQPAGQVAVSVADASGRLPSGSQIQGSPAPAVGTPQSDLLVSTAGCTPTPISEPVTVTTGGDGTATFTVTARDPSNPRGYIDGQVYALSFDCDQIKHRDLLDFISILVFNRYDEEATWANVSKFMAQYARLYPWMNKKLQLDDPTALMNAKDALNTVMNYPIDDPRYMPVIRDLSDSKRKAFLDWLNS